MHAYFNNHTPCMPQTVRPIICQTMIHITRPGINLFLYMYINIKLASHDGRHIYTQLYDSFTLFRIFTNHTTISSYFKCFYVCLFIKIFMWSVLFGSITRNT